MTDEDMISHMEEEVVAATGEQGRDQGVGERNTEMVEGEDLLVNEVGPLDLENGFKITCGAPVD